MIKEPIHILGAGSIGLLWAVSIRSKFPTYPITLLLRENNNSNDIDAIQSSPSTPKYDEIRRCQKIPTMMKIVLERTKTFAQEHHQQQQLEVSVPIQFPCTTLNRTKNEYDNNDGLYQHHTNPDVIKNLIVATKSYQAVNAIRSVMERMKSNVEEVDNNKNENNKNNSRIILLCNGALSVRDELHSLWESTEEEIRNVSSQKQQQRLKPALILATTTHGAYREQEQQQFQKYNETATVKFDENNDKDDPYYVERRKVIHAGFGKTFIENHHENNGDDDGIEICNLWNEVGLNCTSLSKSQMNSMLWNKLAANCVINPLTSIFRCTNGELLLEPSFLELQENILKEVADVAAGILKAEKRNIKTTATSIIDYDDSDNSLSIKILDEMRKFVTQTILDTRNNKSSMYQDIMKRQYTEIEHLNGYIVRKGKDIGKDCPTNEDLYQRIIELHHRQA